MTTKFVSDSIYGMLLLEKEMTITELKNYYLNLNDNILEEYIHLFKTLPPSISTLEYMWYKKAKRNSSSYGQ